MTFARWLHTLRVLQRMFQTHRYVDAPLTVQNRPGGNGAVVRNYLSQFVGAAAMKKRMDEEYPEIKALLVELELAKP